MDETRWLATRGVWALLVAARPRFTARKRRLFACAAARRNLDLTTSATVGAALDAAEAYSDGDLSMAALRRARLAVGAFRLDLAAQATERDDDPAIGAELELCRVAELASSLGRIASASARARSLFSERPEHRSRRAELAGVVRDIFGNPFRPIPLVRPEWRTADALGLARAAHLGDLARLPILADALEEAGCDSFELLGHLRGGGVHVRGCWATDLILGFERDGKAPKVIPAGRLGLGRFRARRVVVAPTHAIFEGAGGAVLALGRGAGGTTVGTQLRIIEGGVVRCTLSPDRLTLTLSPSAAVELRSPWDYEVTFDAGPRKLAQIRAALAAIFAGETGYRDEAG